MATRREYTLIFFARGSSTYRLPPAEAAHFQDALRIYPTNAQVDSYNREHLEKNRKPIINIAGTDTGTTAIIDSRDAGSLQQQLSLYIGAKVMLTKNIWTAKELVNGAIGTVVDLAWNEVLTRSAR
ncbi:hypothetical protein E4U58_007633 [Claviceps cyperi]|nr:hypothetical protein E4U58_007633 [Claviceps cyperi]